MLSYRTAETRSDGAARRQGDCTRRMIAAGVAVSMARRAGFPQSRVSRMRRQISRGAREVESVAEVVRNSDVV